MTMNKSQKKQLAKELYLNTSRTLKEIASMVGVSEPTIIRWKREGNWQTLKQAWANTIDKELPRLYQQLKAFNVYIETKPEGCGSAKDYDALNKLKSIIKAFDKNSLSSEIQTITNFINYLKSIDLDMAKTIIPYADAYLKDQAAKLYKND